MSFGGSYNSPDVRLRSARRSSLDTADLSPFAQDSYGGEPSPYSRGGSSHYSHHAPQGGGEMPTAVRPTRQRQLDHLFAQAAQHLRGMQDPHERVSDVHHNGGQGSGHAGLPVSSLHTAHNTTMGQSFTLSTMSSARSTQHADGSQWHRNMVHRQQQSQQDDEARHYPDHRRTGGVCEYGYPEDDQDDDGEDFEDLSPSSEEASTPERSHANSHSSHSLNNAYKQAHPLPQTHISAHQLQHHAPPHRSGRAPTTTQRVYYRLPDGREVDEEEYRQHCEAIMNESAELEASTAPPAMTRQTPPARQGGTVAHSTVTQSSSFHHQATAHQPLPVHTPPAAPAPAPMPQSAPRRSATPTEAPPQQPQSSHHAHRMQLEGPDGNFATPASRATRTPQSRAYSPMRTNAASPSTYQSTSGAEYESDPYSGQHSSGRSGGGYAVPTPASPAVNLRRPPPWGGGRGGGGYRGNPTTEASPRPPVPARVPSPSAAHRDRAYSADPGRRGSVGSTGGDARHRANPRQNGSATARGGPAPGHQRDNSVGRRTPIPRSASRGRTPSASGPRRLHEERPQHQTAHHVGREKLPQNDSMRSDEMNGHEEFEDDVEARGRAPMPMQQTLSPPGRASMSGHFSASTRSRSPTASPRPVHERQPPSVVGSETRRVNSAFGEQLYLRGMKQHLERQKLEEEREKRDKEKELEEVKRCTFKPKINALTEISSDKIAGQVFDRLSKHEEKRKAQLIQAAEVAARKEVEACSFKPKIGHYDGMPSTAVADRKPATERLFEEAAKRREQMKLEAEEKKREKEKNASKLNTKEQSVLIKRLMKEAEKKREAEAEAQKQKEANNSASQSSIDPKQVKKTIQRLHENKSGKKSLEVLTNQLKQKFANECTFQPAITKQARSKSVGPASDRLYKDAARRLRERDGEEM